MRARLLLLCLGGAGLWAGCKAPSFGGKPVDCQTTRECEARFAQSHPETVWECIPAGLCVQLPFCAEPRRDCTETLDLQPALAARGLDGVFDVAPLFQGEPRSIELEAQDHLAWSPGARLGNTLHEGVDLSRGTVLAWITPEWSTGELPAGGAGLFSIAGFGARVLSDGTLRLERESVASIEFPGLALGWRAGQTRLLVLRWGHRYELGGTEFVADLGGAQVRVNASHSVDIDQLAPGHLLGIAREAEPSPARARIAGLTVYRRPLFDGTMGVDLGQGDELAAIREGRDPAQVTGSWDIVFALPTTQRAGPLGTTAEAYAHPLAEDLLSGHGRFASSSGLDPAFIQVDVAAFSFLPPREQHLGQGFRIRGAAPGTFLSHGLPLLPGESFVARALCWIGETGTGRPRLEVEADGEVFASIEGEGLAGGATAAAPELLLFTGEVPQGALVVKLNLGVAGGVGELHCHGLEVYPNLLPNPSFEAGEGDPWTPTGWRHEINPVAVQASEDSLLFHSGQSALRYIADFSGSGEGGFAHLRPEAPAELVQEGYYAAGGFFRWISGQAPGLGVGNGSLFALTRPVGEGRKFSARVREDQPDEWIRVAGVGRRWRDDTLNSHNDIVHWGAPDHMRDAELVFDDAYLLPLASVPLELHPATVAGSHFDGWARLDGADHLDFRVELAAEEGSVVLAYQRGPPLGLPIGGLEAPCTLLEAWGDDRNFLRVVQLGSDLRVEGEVAGVRQGHDLPGSLPPGAGSPRLAFSWSRDEARLRLGTGVIHELELEERLEVGIGRLRLGENSSGHRDCDLQVLLPGPWVY